MAPLGAVDLLYNTYYVDVENPCQFDKNRLSSGPDEKSL